MLQRELVISNSAFDNRCACWCKMSQLSKRPWLLQASEISELLIDTDSDEAGVSSDASFVEGGTESVPGLSVQFCPVPLTKIPVRVGQLNRFNWQ